MTPEQQRIAIAEACGWVPDVRGNGIWYAPKEHGPKQLPDYLNDLNAMHEAEKVLRQNQFHFVDYYGNLFKVISGKSHYDGDIGYFGFELVNATASQRAEAFLRTIGRWIE